MRFASVANVDPDEPMQPLDDATMLAVRQAQLGIWGPPSPPPAERHRGSG